MSKKAIDLMSVSVNKIVVSDKLNCNEDCFKYFIGYQKVKLLDHYVLFYIKWMGTWNTLNMEAQICIFWLNMKKWKKNTNKFGMW